jgi:hypothetical protein
MFLSLDVGIAANGADTERMEGCELGCRGHQSGQAWGGVGDISDDKILNVRREAIVELSDPRLKPHKLAVEGRRGIKVL